MQPKLPEFNGRKGVLCAEGREQGKHGKGVRGVRLIFSSRQRSTAWRRVLVRVVAIGLLLTLGFTGGLFWRAAEVHREMAAVERQIQAIAARARSSYPPDLVRQVDFTPTSDELAEAFARTLKDWEVQQDLLARVKDALLARFAGQGELEQGRFPYLAPGPFIEREFHEAVNLGLANRIGALEVLLAEARMRLYYLEYERALWAEPWGEEARQTRQRLLGAVEDLRRVAERAHYVD